MASFRVHNPRVASRPAAADAGMSSGRQRARIDAGGPGHRGRSRAAALARRAGSRHTGRHSLARAACVPEQAGEKAAGTPKSTTFLPAHHQQAEERET